MRNTIETVTQYVDTKAILLLTIFGAPVITLFIWGGKLVTEASSK